MTEEERERRLRQIVLEWPMGYAEGPMTQEQLLRRLRGGGREVSRPFGLPYQYVFSPAVWAEWKRVEAEDKARRPPPDREVVHKVGEWWVVPGVSP